MLAGNLNPIPCLEGFYLNQLITVFSARGWVSNNQEFPETDDGWFVCSGPENSESSPEAVQWQLPEPARLSIQAEISLGLDAKADDGAKVGVSNGDVMETWSNRHPFNSWFYFELNSHLATCHIILSYISWFFGTTQKAQSPKFANSNVYSDIVIPSAKKLSTPTWRSQFNA